MKKLEEVIVLTTREYEHWASMQEIVPAIERVWGHLLLAGKAKVESFRTDLAAEHRQLVRRGTASAPDLIVVVAATASSVRTLVHLRTQVWRGTRAAIYIHGDATTGFEALRDFKTLLRKSDSFIVSCEAEAAATKISYPDASTVISPFALQPGFHFNLDALHEAQNAGRELPVREVVYVGRVSEQKNLPTLLVAIWALRHMTGRRHGVILNVYGEEDGHGSPNMGMTFDNYKEYLKGLVRRLGIGHLVRWHGFMDRKWVFENVHSSPHVLVTPSLHADENFGASVFASLNAGAQVVATRWGGHRDYEQPYAANLRLVPVLGSQRGPFVNPFTLAELLDDALLSQLRPVDKLGLTEANASFSEAAIADRTWRGIQEAATSSEALGESQHQHALEMQREEFGNGRHIFRGYSDPLALATFKAYGMHSPAEWDLARTYVVPIGAEIDGAGIVIRDPHRGDKRYAAEPPTSVVPVVRIKADSLQRVWISELVAHELVADGYAFAIPEWLREAE